MAIRAGSQRRIRISTADNGDTFDFGPAGTATLAGTWFFQFLPSIDFVGAIIVFGRAAGNAAADAGAPFLQIPYRRINVGALPSDYALAADPISQAGLIAVGSNMMSVGLMVAVTAGKCDILSWDVCGPISY